MNVHHKRAIVVLCATVVLDMILGTVFGFVQHVGALHGIYCATGTATTVGCDITPASGLAYALSFAEMLTIVPLFAAVFSFFTTGLTASHMARERRKDPE